MVAKKQKRTYQINEVAEMLGMSRLTVYGHARRGTFPCMKLGKVFVIPKDEFDAWLKANLSPGKTVEPKQ